MSNFKWPLGSNHEFKAFPFHRKILPFNKQRKIWFKIELRRGGPLLLGRGRSHKKLCTDCSNFKTANNQPRIARTIISCLNYQNIDTTKIGSEK